MSWGLTESRRARKRRRWFTIAKWLVLLGLIVGAGAFAYATGAKLARIEVRRLEDQVAKLQRRLDEAAATKSRLKSELKQTRADLKDLRRRYAKNVPDGKLARLLKRVKTQLDAGVPPKRLSFVIANASVNPDCPEGPVTKRFIVQTPLTSGAAKSVSFADNAITVTASGQPAQSAAGKPQAWFDAEKPITAVFTRVGGENETAKGKLPLHHAMVYNGEEHRFSIVDGNQRAFAKVTWKRCAFP